jgi:hypothetical protein
MSKYVFEGKRIFIKLFYQFDLLNVYIFELNTPEEGTGHSDSDRIPIFI